MIESIIWNKSIAIAEEFNDLCHPSVAPVPDDQLRLIKERVLLVDVVSTRSGSAKLKNLCFNADRMLMLLTELIASFKNIMTSDFVFSL